MNARRLGFFFALLLLLTGCGGIGTRAFEPVRLNPAPWQDGEVSLFRITNADQQFEGTMTITLTAPDEDVWMFERKVESQNEENVAVILKAENLRPESSVTVRIDSEGVEMVRADYEGSQVELELTTKRNVVTYERDPIPSDTYDYQTLLMLLRALPLTSGYATRLNAYLPIAGLLERIEITISGEESLNTQAGTHAAWQVVLRARNSRSRAWIGVETPHPLLKYIDGTNGATFELTEFSTKAQ